MITMHFKLSAKDLATIPCGNKLLQQCLTVLFETNILKNAPPYHEIAIAAPPYFQAQPPHARSTALSLDSTLCLRQ